MVAKVEHKRIQAGIFFQLKVSFDQGGRNYFSEGENADGKTHREILFTRITL